MATKSKPELIPVDLQGWRYWAGVGFALSLFPITWLLTGTLGGIHMGSTTIWYSHLIMVLLVLWYLEGWRYYETDKIIAISVLGYEAREVLRGWHWIPRGLMQAFPVSRGLMQFEFPGEPEQISNVPDDEEFRTEMLKPMRVTTGDQKGDGTDILDSRQTYEPRVTVEFQFQQKGVFEIVINLPGKTIEQKLGFVLRTLRDSAQEALELKLPEYSGGTAIDKKAEIIDFVRNHLVEESEPWGICIRDVNVLNLVPSHAVNIALDKIPAAKATARAMIIESEGKRTSLINEGQGRAGARKAELVAEGEGIAEAAQKTTVDPKEWRRGEIAVAAMNKGTTVIGVEGLTQLYGIAERLKGGRADD